MVVKMMHWRPWPSHSTRKLQVRITLHRLEGLPVVGDEAEKKQRIMVDVKWKGPKPALGLRLGRALKRGRTSQKLFEEGSIITWDEHFEHDCLLSVGKKASFQPWNVHFVVLQVSQQGNNTKVSVKGTAILNVAGFIPSINSSHTLRICVSRPSGEENGTSLVVTVNYIKLRNADEDSNAAFRIRSPLISCIGSNILKETDKQCGEHSSDWQMKVLKCLFTGKSGKELFRESDMLDDSKHSSRSGESYAEYSSSDSFEDYDSEGIGIDDDDNIRTSFSYGTLEGVNRSTKGSLLCCRDDTEASDGTENIVSIHSPKVSSEVNKFDSEHTPLQMTVRSFLPWRKRKLSFRSSRARGEPLLNKAYGENGGDDIDFDRRQSSSIDSHCALQVKKHDDCSLISQYLDFGDECFSIGSWEKKLLVSRDEQMKLTAEAFFASIDQRSERAAGESACTALVAVIAEWLHQNPNRMPIRAEFDALIREGSAEWKRLCELDAYRDRFPDHHFDLDTILQAEIRPLMVVPERSFIGFFQPEGLAECCEFLQGAMSFESIWEAIREETLSVKSQCCEPAVYIVSWNDHFFVLKAEKEAYYVIDTLGERLFEGCNQAYMLHFDKDASICGVPTEQGEDGEKKVASAPLAETRASSPSTGDGVLNALHGNAEDALPRLETAEQYIVCKGKEACKHFLKDYFAALPLKELQSDIRKGLIEKVPLHKRLQIEFHYTLLRSGQGVPAF